MRSKFRDAVKPILYRLMGRKGYLHAQVFGKVRDVKYRRREEPEMELLADYVGPGDAVVDVGANFGYYTERLSGLVGDSGRVYGFEPVPFTFDVLQRVLANRKVANAEVFRRGVGAKNETTRFTVPVVNFGGISGGLAHMSGRVNDEEEKAKYYDFEASEEVEAEVVRLDDFLMPKLAEGGRKVSLVKIDVEGAEFFALQGMAEMLKTHRPRVIIEIQPYMFGGYGVEEAQLKELIDSLGYDTFLYEGGGRELVPHEGAYPDRNFVLVPRDAAS